MDICRKTTGKNTLTQIDVISRKKDFCLYRNSQKTRSSARWEIADKCYSSWLAAKEVKSMPFTEELGTGDVPWQAVTSGCSGFTCTMTGGLHLTSLC